MLERVFYSAFWSNTTPTLSPLISSASQFEQPFEDTAALNLWSKERDEAPDAHVRDARIREHVLAYQLEESIARDSRKDSGIVLDALANGKRSPYYDALGEQRLRQEREAMVGAVHWWRHEMSHLPGGDPAKRDNDRPADELVDNYLNRTHCHIMREASQEGWHVGDRWDLSQTATLPRGLRDRCKAATESSPFMSICG